MVAPAAAACSQMVHTRHLSGSFACSSSSAWDSSNAFVSLNNIADNPGARKKVTHAYIASACRNTEEHQCSKLT